MLDILPPELRLRIAFYCGSSATRILAQVCQKLRQTSWDYWSDKSIRYANRRGFLIPDHRFGCYLRHKQLRLILGMSHLLETNDLVKVACTLDHLFEGLLGDLTGIVGCNNFCPCDLGVGGLQVLMQVPNRDYVAVELFDTRQFAGLLINAKCINGCGTIIFDSLCHSRCWRWKQKIFSRFISHQKQRAALVHNVIQYNKRSIFVACNDLLSANNQKKFAVISQTAGNLVTYSATLLRIFEW